jgi:hypothetical protein
MKYLGLAIAFLFCVMVFSQPAYGQCSGGKIDGIYHTSCYPWTSGDGTISGTTTLNDTPRLQRAINAAFGKLLFDEGDYFLNDELTVYSYRILEGTGRGVYFAQPTPTPLPNPTPTPQAPSDLTSKIIQTANNKAIFKIGEGIYSVSIRDMALESGLGATGTIGILFRGGDVNNYSSINFEMTNLTFDHLDKGIYVNAVDNPNVGGDQTGLWQCDGMRLEHAAFQYCNIGVHINSNNSGWNISSIETIVPAGNALSTGTPLDGNHTYALFLERSTYTSINLVIGNGDLGSPASALIYVKEHANLSISNVVDEGFRNSIYIQGGDRSSPIYLSNNFYMSPVTVNASTVVSTANQFYSSGGTYVPAYATGYAQIYSYGDKFCFEGGGCTSSTYATSGGASVVSSVNQFNAASTVPHSINYDTSSGIPAMALVAPTSAAGPLLRLGRGSFWFDITRSEADGSLWFKGNQNDYSQYVFDTNNGGKVTLNNDGSVTYGTIAFSALGAAVGSAVNGTVVYCSNCTKATPCASGGNGAIAKRINSAWDCN